MPEQSFTIIGDLINNSYGRAARAFRERNMAGYQALAISQTEVGAKYLDINIDATQKMMVELDEMVALLPDLIPAIQEVCDTPLCFDNPSIKFQEVALAAYKRTENNKPILNSISASRENLDDMIALVKEYDTKVVVMCSECFIEGGRSKACQNGEQIHETAKIFVQRLKEEANRELDDIILDPGLAPIAADTYGLVHMGLVGMNLIRQDPDLKGIHMSVGLTNFSFGVPKKIRTQLEYAFLTLATEAGMDFVLGNPEKNLQLLPRGDRFLENVTAALEAGLPKDGETQEDAGIRQAEKIMELFI